tara:strand:- start:927 stop:2054 length:1128 start_codon:yes stop_codon:yes gene_type:complete
MANTTPSTPNTVESGHPGNEMTHTGIDAHEGSTVTSDAGEHSHLHFDDGYKLHFGEIASLFEDIQADIRIITNRATDYKKGNYTRTSDRNAPTPEARILQAAKELNFEEADVLKHINAELARPSNFDDLHEKNFAGIRAGGKHTSYSGGLTSRGPDGKPVGYAGSDVIETPEVDALPYGDGATKIFKSPNDISLVDLKASPLSPTGGGSGIVKYANQGKIRSRPIQSQLMNIIKGAASAASVNVAIFSGGQLRYVDGGIKNVSRTGSNRHDLGYGADVYLYNDKFKSALNSSVAADLRVMVTFVEAAKGAGATAAGFGNTYMDDIGIHVDIALLGQAAGDLTGIKPGNCWGGRDPTRKYAPTFALAPQCLKDIWA